MAVRMNEGPAGWEKTGPQKLPDVYERGSGRIVRAAPRIDKGQKERAEAPNIRNLVPYPAKCSYKQSEAVVGLKTREELVDHPDEPTDYDNQQQPHAP